MAHTTRLSLPGRPHHILQRGNNRQCVFFDDEDRALFLRWLGEAATVQDCAVHAYVLMDNHFHLLMTAGRTESVARVMQSLGRRYVGHVNSARHRTGTLWEGRYKSTILESEPYVLACQRYIETNPLRARLAARPEDYPWSSYRRHALGAADPMLKPHETYLALGASPAERQAAYRALFAQELDATVIATLRDAVQRGWAAGSEGFRHEIEAALGRSVDPPRRGRPPKAGKTPRPAVFESVSGHARAF